MVIVPQVFAKLDLLLKLLLRIFHAEVRDIQDFPDDWAKEIGSTSDDAAPVKEGIALADSRAARLLLGDPRLSEALSVVHQTVTKGLQTITTILSTDQVASM